MNEHIADTVTTEALPGFSIVVTCYNQERYIRKALASVFEQDYKGPMELIVVDDCSTDNSYEEIRKCVDELGKGWEVTLLRNESNLGVAGATNRGWQQARYDWIVGVDGDDIQFTDRCRRSAMSIAEHPEAGMLIFSVVNMGPRGEVSGERAAFNLYPYDKVPNEVWLTSPEQIFNNLYAPELLPQKIWGMGGTSVSRRSLYLKWSACQESPEEYDHCSQDRVWTWRYMLSSPIYASKEPTCYYRSHDSNLFNRHTTSGRQNYREYLASKRQHYRWMKMRYYSLRLNYADAAKALNTPGLSNWPPELIQAARRNMEQELPVLEFCHDWWDIPWHRRLLRALRSRHVLRGSMRLWPWNRLLPFHLTAFLRWFISARKR